MTRRKVEDIEIIRKKFPKEWVLLANYGFNKMNCLAKGAIIAHSRTRDDIYQEQMKYKEALAIEYTGVIPKDLAVMF